MGGGGKSNGEKVRQLLLNNNIKEIMLNIDISAKCKDFFNARVLNMLSWEKKLK